MTSTLDASLLLMPLVGFLPVDDPHIARTIAALLEHVIAISNDAGLLSEEYDASSRGLTGNIPQALTHVGVTNTALFLSGPVIQRAGG